MSHETTPEDDIAAALAVRHSVTVRNFAHFSRRLLGHWVGDKVADGQLLRALGCPHSFDDSQFDSVLRAVSAAGFTLVSLRQEEVSDAGECPSRA